MTDQETVRRFGEAPTGTYQLRPGGLMRCCTKSLDDYLVEHGVEQPIGTVVACKWCSNYGAVLAPDGVWQWNRLGRSRAEQTAGKE